MSPSMDVLSKERRSWNMSRIGSRNTKPEILVRQVLHGLGYRFRLHAKSLPGHPDIVLPKYRTVVLVHGCFWHRHKNCKYAYTPKSKMAFWTAKFSENIKRDSRKSRALSDLGWRVIVVWECELQNSDRLRRRLKSRIK